MNGESIFAVLIASFLVAGCCGGSAPAQSAAPPIQTYSCPGGKIVTDISRCPASELPWQIAKKTLQVGFDDCNPYAMKSFMSTRRLSEWNSSADASASVITASCAYGVSMHIDDFKVLSENIEGDAAEGRYIVCASGGYSGLPMYANCTDYHILFVKEAGEWKIDSDLNLK